ncbi:MAG TPA: phosphatase [Pusillimonas sp.]|jgi:predicted metal-dependent phosphoesterase TrpH|nr:phosphatase [Pusillimonas sp.]MBC43636.1 phosphatase [Pusillimonas sp.]HBT32980.1 phosphatase [Pusillimonas sp.]|tara:strand:+ start:88011 stop:88856 length:846 start_codon:yes stop_codon:yes gene_type:complete
MKNVELNADLHCHSSQSDGVLAPRELALRAARQGVQIWSLTDHDELSGLMTAGAVASEQGLQFVPGVEISVTWMNRTIHIVGLNIDPANAQLVTGLEDIRLRRGERARAMGDKLEKLGFAGCYEGALSYASNALLLSRTHFARFMLEQGYCSRLQQVFDLYLGEGKPGFVGAQWASLEQALGWIHASGGVAVVAHPGRYRLSSNQFDALFDAFRDLGGDAIEVVTGSHYPAQYLEYANVARRYGFLASRGSDFHSPGESRIDLGQLPQLPPGLDPVWSAWL